MEVIDLGLSADGKEWRDVIGNKLWREVIHRTKLKAKWTGGFCRPENSGQTSGNSLGTVRDQVSAFATLDMELFCGDNSSPGCNPGSGGMKKPRRETLWSQNGQ